MSNTYKPVSPWAKARHGEDVVELDMSASEEADALSGHFELVPRRYKVTSKKVADREVGDEFDAAYLVEQEQMLLSAGHLERVESKKPVKKTTPKKSSDD
jgi:hypothetical protein